jgi:hypothetical protein
METGFNFSDILSAVDSVLDNFKLTDTLNIILQSLCAIVVVWQFAQITIQNLLRAGEGFAFENYKKPVFYLIMIAGWPLLQSFILDASKGIAQTVVEQQKTAYDVNSKNFAKVDDVLKEIEDRTAIVEQLGSSDNIGPIDYVAFQISILDDKITISALQSVYKTSLVFDSFLYVMFYFFSKLWLKITLLGGGIAFTVSLLTGGWTVLINWAKTVLSISLWIPLSALLMTLINSILIKILNEMLPEFPVGTSVSGADLVGGLSSILGNLVSFLLIYIALTLIFIAFKIIILAKVPAIVSGWVGGGNSVGSGFASAFIPLAVAKSATSAATGAATSGANKGFSK